MFGFGKKKKKKEQQTQARMHVIPDIFYGGNDPVIYHQKQGTEEKKKQKKEGTKSPSKASTGPSWIVVHKKIFMIVGGVILLVTIGGATWYYIGQVRSTTFVSNTVVPEIVDEPVEEGEEVIVEDEPEVIIPTTTLEIEEEELPLEVDTGIDPVSFPRILLIDGPDSDADELTDEEEAIFATNLDVWDSDGDGYYDGQEVINLYNPNGFSPVKLIDSGTVAEYTNPTWKYRLYYPIGWQIGEVDIESRQVLISTLSGDFIEVRIFDRAPGMTFQDWFAVSLEGESFQDVRVAENRFKESGWRRKDGLVGYFLSDTHVTVLIYHPGVTGAVPYRNVMRMVYESFRPTKNTIVLPDQVLLPTPPVIELDTPTTTTTTTTPSSTVSNDTAQ